jgi:hypothetical protein
MNNSFMRTLVLLVCFLSLTLHFSAESAGMLTSAWAHAGHAHGPETHGEEDHFVPVLAQDESRAGPNKFAVVLAMPGGFSCFLIPQLPPPKPV